MTPEEEINALKVQLEAEKKKSEDSLNKVVAGVSASIKNSNKGQELGVIPSKRAEETVDPQTFIQISLFDGAPLLANHIKVFMVYEHLVPSISLFSPEAQHYALVHGRQLIHPNHSEKDLRLAKAKLEVWNEVDHLLDQNQFWLGFMLMLKAVAYLLAPKDESTAIWTDGIEFKTEVECRVMTSSTWPVWREYALHKLAKFKTQIGTKVPWENNRLSGFEQATLDTAIATFGLQATTLNTSFVQSLSGRGQSFLGALIQIAVQDTPASKTKVSEAVQQMHDIAARELRGEQVVGEMPSVIGAGRWGVIDAVARGGTTAARRPPITSLPFFPHNNSSPASSTLHPPPTYSSNPRPSPYPLPSTSSSSSHSFRGTSASPQPASGAAVRCLSCRGYGHTHMACRARRLEIIQNDNLQSVEADRGKRIVCRNFNLKRCSGSNCVNAHCCSICGKKGHAYEDCREL
ncbi:hypothetical protein JCM16303_004087 [Sporobolomyces ruberrimus]